MKQALALLLLSCVLVAQENPSSSAIQSIDPALVKNVSGGSVVEGPITVDVIKPAKAKPAIPPVNVRDELIELIHALKVKAHADPYRPTYADAPSAAMYDAGMKAKTEAQRLLLQALVELSKLPAESPTVYHSANPKPVVSLESKSNIGRKPIIIK
jgi:hypothetical protein